MLLNNPDAINKFKRATEFLKQAIEKEWSDQGHNATGKTISSLEITFKEQGDCIVIESYGDKVLVIQDKGVKRQNMRIGWKKWKEVATGWARIIKPSASSKEIDRFLYFVWRKHKQEGMPTKGSFAWSRNGRRKEWSKATVFNKGLQDDLFQIIDLAGILQGQLDELVSDLNRSFAA